MKLRNLALQVLEKTGHLEGGDKRYMPKHLKHPDLNPGDTVKLDSLRSWLKGALLFDNSVDVTTTNSKFPNGEIPAKLFHSMPKERRENTPWEIEDGDKVRHLDIDENSRLALNLTARYIKARALAEIMDQNRAAHIWNILLSGDVENEKNPFRKHDNFHSARFVAVAAAMKLNHIRIGSSHTEDNQCAILIIENALVKLGFSKPKKDVNFGNPAQRNKPPNYHLR
ncbi:hypothetical protein COU74_05415 [Candidatus Peregrinibacteria bacterium CG10_big_fil_rev_8_21_14_0_10_36_19]|nr:MAG: hypothetical protein COU74_05415 [Candidatus Peregrinibacteria bacterium CG10_big_fil_rev_8_21_14_0_10_36_19]